MVLLVLTPLVVSAGSLSFLGDIFGIDAEAYQYVRKSEPYNSQNISLLEAASNPIDPKIALGGGDIIIVGDALLAETGPAGTIADIDPTTTSGKISVYVVREGDTLSQIADMFDVSVGTIYWANDIKRSDEIQVGQKLVILPITGVRHVVKDGDTLKKIAEKYEGDMDEILSYNGLASGALLEVGDTVIIPDGQVEIPKPTRSSSGTVVRTGPTYAGYYMKPISGGTRSQGLHGYNGVDLATYYGAEIYAAAPGRVIVSKNGGWNGGYGNYVVIEHDNGTQTLYAHNSQNIVGVGQSVVQGQVVGYVGSTGRSTGSHVHFEVRGAQNPF